MRVDSYFYLNHAGSCIALETFAWILWPTKNLLINEQPSGWNAWKMDDGQLLFYALHVDSGPLIIHSIIGAGRVGGGGTNHTKSCFKVAPYWGSEGMHPLPPRQKMKPCNTWWLNLGAPGVHIHQLLFINKFLLILSSMHMTKHVRLFEN